MYVDGADGHDLLSVSLAEVSQQQVDQCVQLGHLKDEEEDEEDGRGGEGGGEGRGGGRGEE